MLYAFALETLDKRAPRPGIPAASAVFATGAVAALALALTFALERGWLTVALALMVPGIAWVSDQRPLPALRVLAAVSRRTGAGAHRLGAHASSATMWAPDRSSTGCSMAMAFPPLHSCVGRLASAPPWRRTGAHAHRSRVPFC